MPCICFSDDILIDGKMYISVSGCRGLVRKIAVYFSRVGAARCFCALFAQKPETACAKMSEFGSFCVHQVALNGEAVKSNKLPFRGCGWRETVNFIGREYII